MVTQLLCMRCCSKSQLLLQPDMLLTRPRSNDSQDLSHVLVVLPPEPNLMVGLLALLLSG
jgi:hypothetical protein